MYFTTKILPTLKIPSAQNATPHAQSVSDQPTISALNARTAFCLTNGHAKTVTTTAKNALVALLY